MKKYLAEMLGTAVLVLLGCGTAVSLNCTSNCVVASNAASVVGTAMAFGLAVIAMAYSIGKVSGCHINPAITLGCLLAGRISGKDAICYMISQVVGAFIGSAILFALTYYSNLNGTGANACQEGVGLAGGFIAEVVFTFVFVFVVLATTDSKKGAGDYAGLAIGLTLILVHLACIRYTGTSVNPARSIAPAIFQGGAALEQLWIFVLAPFVGASIAAGSWKIISDEK